MHTGLRQTGSWKTQMSSHSQPIVEAIMSQSTVVASLGTENPTRAIPPIIRQSKYSLCVQSVDHSYRAIPVVDQLPSRRQNLQRRMPSRARIQAIIDRRPAHDPWLDDEHDWRP
jgi:hypothetical protein